ncbi:HAD family hydrolase [Halorhabdus sp. BNX81]|uniref:HAD family hydrolase n=1 Tax=Halorhabdus sp. BNX81 TaxID=2980181 RepID=UPI0023DCF464|nr:HAD family hydrolase [Halorhabdus sp. BNX81]WEL20756.1 HAD superfamily hydrolase [Halorhabdus sp. BNX81]
MTVNAVVFDLDETLAVTTRDRGTLIEEATAVAGGDPIEYTTYQDTHHEAVTSETRAPIFEAVIDDETVDPDAVADTYREAVNDALVPVDGASDLLAHLTNGAGYRVGVLTDGPVRAQRSKLDVLGWDDYLDASVVTGALKTRKPDPIAFEAILEEMSVRPSEAVYVGDKPEVDVAGAKDAGLAAVQVLYPGGPELHPRADAAVDRDKLRTDLLDVLAGL